MAKINRDDIIKAAVDLFNENSYHATSMQDIAHAIKIKKPSLYHHFDSKEAILLAILEIGMDELINSLQAVVQSNGGCEEKLRSAIHIHAGLIANNPNSAGVFLREDRGLGDKYIAQYVEKRDQFEHLFRVIVQQGVEEGIFRDTDVTITVQALLGMVNWMTRWYRPSGRLSAKEIADIFANLVLNGLKISTE